MSRQWQFPRGQAGPDESPEEAMRRVANDNLGIEVEVIVGQPPLLAELGGSTVEIRYFFCEIVLGEPKAGPYRETRWVPKGHLREYELDGPSRDVAAWLLETK